MNKYVLLSDLYEPDFFSAKDDEEAEQYVEEKYSSDDGPMKLHRLEPVTEWP